MSSNYLISFLRKLLYPISFLYGIILFLRNTLYDFKILKSFSFNIPVVCVGNISTGGTGKSPMVNFIIHLVKQKYHPVILSRGYRRKTKGYLIANDTSSATDLGDEPYLMYQKNNQRVNVVVAEDRVKAVTHILRDLPKTNLILMDDGFQHRSIQPSFNIVLTNYYQLFYNDYFLPTGNLRDEKRSISKADIIVVTKCKKDLALTEKNEIIAKMQLNNEKKVFFTAIEYDHIYHLFHKKSIELNSKNEVILLTGIANTFPIEAMFQKNNIVYHKLSFKDHHQFTAHDIRKLVNNFESIQSKNKIIITTEKDAVRLIVYKTELKDLPVYVLPMKIQFLFNEENLFSELVLNHITEFSVKK